METRWQHHGFMQQRWDNFLSIAFCHLYQEQPSLSLCSSLSAVPKVVGHDTPQRTKTGPFCLQGSGPAMGVPMML